MKTIVKSKLLRKLLIVVLMIGAAVWITDNTLIRDVQAKTVSKARSGGCEDACYATYHNRVEYINNQYEICLESPQSAKDQCETDSYNEYNECLEYWCQVSSACISICLPAHEERLVTCEGNYAGASQHCNDTQSSDQQTADSNYADCLNGCS